MKIAGITLCILLVCTFSLYSENMFEAETEGFVIRWRIEGETLIVVLRAETTGWISAGFKPQNAMQGANIIIGYIDGEEIILEDHFGTGRFSHKSDLSLGGEDNILDVSGFEEGGFTEIGFTLPLNSEDRYDAVLKAGEKISVIVAYGKNDSIRSKHRKRGKIEIVL